MTNRAARGRIVKRGDERRRRADVIVAVAARADGRFYLYYKHTLTIVIL